MAAVIIGPCGEPLEPRTDIPSQFPQRSSGTSHPLSSEQHTSFLHTSSLSVPLLVSRSPNRLLDADLTRPHLADMMAPSSEARTCRSSYADPAMPSPVALLSWEAPCPPRLVLWCPVRLIYPLEASRVTASTDSQCPLVSILCILGGNSQIPLG